MAVLCVLLAVICLYDYLASRIPNGVVGAILLYGLGYRYWDAGGRGIFDYFVSFLTVLVLMYLLFKIGTIGAGDVKLYAAAAGYLSGRALACFLFYSLLFAAMFSLIKMWREGIGKERVFYFCSYLKEICRSGQWKLYFSDRAEMARAGICLSGPALLSFFLHLGGVY